jgi:hypothetical protein
MSVPKARRPSVPDLSRQLPSASGLPARARTDSVLIPVQPLQPRAAQSAQAQDVAGPSESQGFTGVPVPAGSPRAAADLQDARNKLARLLANLEGQAAPALRALAFKTYDAKSVLTLVGAMESFETARRDIDLPAQPGEAWVQDVRRALASTLEARVPTFDVDRISLKQFYQLRVAMRRLRVMPEAIAALEALELQAVCKKLGVNPELPYATRRCEQEPWAILASGDFCTVFSTVGTLANGRKFPGAYKPDRQENREPMKIGTHNVAVSAVDKRLRFGVIAETHLMLNEISPGQWEHGCLMALAKGFSPINRGEVTMDVGDLTAQSLQNNWEQFEERVQLKGFGTPEIRGTNVKLIPRGNIMVDGELECWGMVPLGDIHESNLRANLTRLQAVDFITATRDRLGNYFIDKGCVTGFDNDFSFGKVTTRIPRVMDAAVVDALLRYDSVQLAEDCRGLDEHAIEAAQIRLRAIQERIETYVPGPQPDEEMEGEPAGWVMGPGQSWSTQGIARVLGAPDDYVGDLAVTIDKACRAGAPSITLDELVQMGHELNSEAVGKQRRDE